jgi:hypothetical protein
MDGTHSPTNNPCSLSTENHRKTENKKDRPAAARIKSFAIFTLFKFHLPRVRFGRHFNIPGLVTPPQKVLDGSSPE